MESSVYRGYASMIGATAPADVQQKGLTAGVAEGTPSPAETGQGATSKHASVSNRRGDQTSSAVLVLQAPRHLSDMLLDYPLAPPSEIIAEVGGVSHKWDWGKVGNSSAPNSGKGLLLSGFFTLPVLNADSRIASVRFELEGQQHLLHEFSVRVAKAPTRSSKAEYFTSSTSLRQDDDNAVLSRERGHSGYRSGSAAAGESDLDIPPGQLLLVPLQLFVADESIQTSRSKEPRDIYLICKKQEGGGIAGMLSLSVIPARGNRLLVPLIFPCRRLNETLLFSFQLSDGSVSEAVVIAPVMALPGVNSKVEMQTGEAEPSASSQKQRHPATPKQQDSEVASSEPISIRGKGVASRGSSGGSRDKARRGSDASKRFDTLRSVNAADYSSSTAARLMAEREDTLNSATKYNLLSKDSADRAAGTAFNPAPAVDVIIESDVAVFKSQFYVHHNSFVRGKVVSSEEEEIFFQYTCNSKVGYMVSALSFAHGERDSFPVLISLHGEESNAREMAESYRVLARGTLPGLGRHTDTHVSRLGVEGFWVLAPSRRSARRGLLWDHVSMESIEDAVMALSRLTRSFQRLPGVVTEAGRLVMGHGAGAHAAVLAALSRADAVSCLAPISLSFLRKESLTEIGSVDSFFGVDAAFMDPALVELLTRSQAEQHIDRLAENAVDMAVLVRVGARDTVSHPWISKRFNRLVLEAISSAEPIAMIKLDIVRNQGHWWSDTVTAGDGGVTNDIHMREFYSHCRARSWHDLQAYAHYYTDQDLQALSTSSDLIEESVSTDGSADKSIDTVRNISELPQQESQRCGLAAFTLSLFNPSSNNGMCGIRVIQQLRSLSKSEVHVQVLRFPRRQLIIRAVREINMQQKSRASENSFEDFEPKEEEMAYFDASAYAAAIDMAEMESDWVGTLNRQPLSGAEAGGDAAANMKRSVRKKILSHPELDGLFTLPTHIRSGGICIVRTLNVRRLQLNQLLKLACRGNYSLGAIGSTQTLPTLLIVDGRIIRQPGSLASAVIDRVLVQLDLCWSSTGTNQRDISVFLCSRPVDPLVERAAVAPGSLKTLLGGPLAVVFGTPSHLNLRHMLRDLAVYIASSVASSTGKYVPLLSDFEYRDMLNGDVKSVGFTGFENVVFIGGPDSNKAVRDIYDFASAEAAIGAQMPVSFSKQHHGFTLGSRHFDSPEDAVLFLFPMARLQQSNNPIPPQFTASFDSPKLVPVSPFVGICIAANSLSGYFHASRLLHSNNLISTQGPFFSMLPDFVVFSAQIWSHGLAKGSQLVGYWNATWNFDEAQSCSSSNKYF